MSVEAIAWVLNQARKRDGTDLSPSATLVLIGVANHADPDGYAYPGVSRLAEYARMTRESARRHLRALEAEGLIETQAKAAPDSRIPADRRPNLYRLLMNDPTPVRGRAETDPTPMRGRDPSLTHERPHTSEGETISQPSEEPSTDAPALTLVEQPVDDDPVQRVFSAWQRSTGRHRAKLDGKRARAIGNALRLGYTVDELCAAVKGWQFSSFHAGQNAEGRVWNDLGLLLRDAEHIERFRDAALTGKTAARRERQRQLLDQYGRNTNAWLGLDDDIKAELRQAIHDADQEAAS